MKVALVYPRFKWFEYNGLSEPLGVLHLVSALREAGHEPVYLDYSFCSEITELDHLAEGAGIVAVAISAATPGDFTDSTSRRESPGIQKKPFLWAAM